MFTIGTNVHSTSIADLDNIGYPFRAVFIVDKYNKYYDELTEKEHQLINHRLKALKRLTKRIEDLTNVTTRNNK